ncbi:hypothetical protein STVA_36450 [Allostella vacuolata]|nr:hypothetical protein STVA_36450 [Stella vacuolata]
MHGDAERLGLLGGCGCADGGGGKGGDGQRGDGARQAGHGVSSSAFGPITVPRPADRPGDRARLLSRYFYLISTLHFGGTDGTARMPEILSSRQATGSSHWAKGTSGTRS